MDQPYHRTTLSDFIEENNIGDLGESFMLVMVEKPGEDGDAHIRVVASAMSLEMMRAMILAASYHHNVQEDSLDVLITERPVESTND
jgi:hypothetical protein